MNKTLKVFNILAPFCDTKKMPFEISGVSGTSNGIIAVWVKRLEILQSAVAFSRRCAHLLSGIIDLWQKK